MGWLRQHRDILIVTTIGGLLATVGGGYVLTNVFSGSSSSSNDAKLVAEAVAAVTKATTPTAKVTSFAAPPAPPASPPPAAPPPAAPPPAPPASHTSSYFGGALAATVGPVTGGTVSKITLKAGGTTCVFEHVGTGESVGVAGRPVYGLRVKQIAGDRATVEPVSRARVRSSVTCLRASPQ